MAVGTKLTRLIVIDGSRYHWRVMGSEYLEQLSAAYELNGSNWEPDRLVVRPKSALHMTLTVEWPACTKPCVTPGEVRKYVKLALDKGWMTQTSHFVIACEAEAIIESVQPAWRQ